MLVETLELHVTSLLEIVITVQNHGGVKAVRTDVLNSVQQICVTWQMEDVHVNLGTNQVHVWMVS